jgi:hypothetical protein
MLHWAGYVEVPEYPDYVLPHSDFGDPDCCGLFFPVERGDSADITCNECACSEIGSVADLQHTLDQMELSQDLASEKCDSLGIFCLPAARDSGTGRRVNRSNPVYRQGSAELTHFLPKEPEAWIALNLLKPVLTSQQLAATSGVGNDEFVTRRCYSKFVQHDPQNVILEWMIEESQSVSRRVNKSCRVRVYDPELRNSTRLEIQLCYSAKPGRVINSY